MYRILCTVVLLSISTLAVCSFAQDKPGIKSKSGETRDVDPLALDVLKAATQPIEQAQAFSFKALVSEESGHAAHLSGCYVPVLGSRRTGFFTNNRDEHIPGVI